MNADSGLHARQADEGPVDWTLVWIDARDATVARWRNGEAVIERIESNVPVHHASTGHVRHDPMVRHGGGGWEQTAGDPRRQERLDRFVEAVRDRLPATGGVEIIGPGSVRRRLQDLIVHGDERQRRTRPVSSHPARRLTDPQLVARLHELRGDVSRRQTVGAFRWTGPQPHRSSGDERPPRHVVEKSPEHEPR